MRNKSLSKKILLGIPVTSTGSFPTGYKIGTGNVTTRAKVGAKYGMSWTWGGSAQVYIYLYFN